MIRTSMVVSAAAMAAGYTTMQVLGRRAGSTVHERAARLHGDEFVHDPQMVMNHGVTIEARAEEIWPWLTQMGWHLAGYYTPHWVDKLLFPENWESLERLDPRLVRELRIGDVIPDGKPGTAYFRVALIEQPNLLVHWGVGSVRIRGMGLRDLRGVGRTGAADERKTTPDAGRR